MPQARAATPTRPRASASFWETVPVSSNRAWTDGAFQRTPAAPATSFSAGLEPGDQLLGPRRLDVPEHAAGPDQAAAEPVAADQRGRVEEVAPEPAAVRRRGQEADVAGQRPEVARVVGQAFEFQRDRPEHLRPERRLATGQRLDGLAVRQHVADRRVAGQPPRSSWIVRLSGPPTSARSIPRCWKPSEISRWKTCSPWHWNRKWPGSMTPAWTGPTATSWISGPSTW